MKVVVLTDGTVPLVVGRVISSDFYGEDEEERFTQRIREDAQLFDVPDDSTALLLTWDEGGFTVTGYPLLEGAFIGMELFAYDFEREPEGGEYFGGGHWAMTVDPGEDEGYAHVYDMEVR